MKNTRLAVCFCFLFALSAQAEDIIVCTLNGISDSAVANFRAPEKMELLTFGRSSLSVDHGDRAYIGTLKTRSTREGLIYFGQLFNAETPRMPFEFYTSDNTFFMEWTNYFAVARYQCPKSI